MNHGGMDLDLIMKEKTAADGHTVIQVRPPFLSFLLSFIAFLLA